MEAALVAGQFYKPEAVRRWIKELRDPGAVRRRKPLSAIDKRELAARESALKRIGEAMSGG